MREAINTASLSKLGFVKFSAIEAALQELESNPVIHVTFNNDSTPQVCRLTAMRPAQRLCVLEGFKPGLRKSGTKMTLQLEGASTLSFEGQLVGPLVEGQDDVLMVKVPHFSWSLLRRELAWPTIELNAERRNPASR